MQPASGIFCVCVLFGQTAPAQSVSEFGQITNPGEVYRLLQRLAVDALSIPDGIGAERVAIRNRVLIHDLRQSPNEDFASHPDRLTSPLEILIRVAVLRRDFQKYLPTQVAWREPLDRCEMLAGQMVTTASKGVSDPEWRKTTEAYQAEAEKIFGALNLSVTAYARQAGLNPVDSRGSPGGFKTEIKIDPAKARIRVMPFLNYKRCMYFGLSLEQQWNDLTEGVHELIGRYHYRADWPASLNGPEEGNFDVSATGTITFRPKAN